VGITLAISLIGTLIITYIVKYTVGLRVNEETETAGLDISEHGEEAYHS